MKNIVCLIVFSTLFILSCNKNEPKDYTVISGRIINPQSDSVYVFLNDREKAIVLNAKGEFYDTIHLKNKGYYYFSDGREQSEIFLIPGDSLFITVDTKNFDESIKFSGKGAEKNNYLAQKLLREEALATSSADVFTLEPYQFKEKFEKHTTELENILEKAPLEEEFLQVEKKNLRYGYLSLLLQYPDAYKYFTKHEAKLPSGFLKELEEIDFDNTEDYELIPTYQDLIVNKYMLEVEKNSDGDHLEKMIAELKSDKIKQDILYDLFFRISSTNPESEKINNIIQKYASNSELKEKAAQKMASIRDLMPGKATPNFEFEDVHGKKVSLAQLKGKLVYIDVWATWCGPCLQEIPALKQLEADYQDQNIFFVSVSIDEEKDNEKWKKMLVEKKMKGIQLFARPEVKEQFSATFGINSIPYFILLDQNGHILQADAPRPSDPAVREILDKNL